MSCLMLHPGTVDTDLSAPFQKVRLRSMIGGVADAPLFFQEGLFECHLSLDSSRRLLVNCLVQNVKPEKLFTRDTAIRQLLAIIDKATMADTASFRAWDDTPIPW